MEIGDIAMSGMQIYDVNSSNTPVNHMDQISIIALGVCLVLMGSSHFHLTY